MATPLFEERPVIHGLLKYSKPFWLDTFEQKNKRLSGDKTEPFFAINEESVTQAEYATALQRKWLLSSIRSFY